MDINLKLSKEQERTIELWSEIFTAFNFIQYDAESGKFVITGADYDSEPEFNTAAECLEFITEEVKSALLFYAMVGDTESLSHCCRLQESTPGR